MKAYFPLLLVQVALFVSHENLAAQQCTPLHIGTRLTFTITPKLPACFLVLVPKGISVQIVSDQPQDIALEAKAASNEIVVDSFEIGPETLTLPSPGQFQVLVRLVSPAVSPPHPHIALRTLPSARTATAWIAAERKGTIAKRSGRLDDADRSFASWRALGDVSSMGRSQLQRAEAFVNTEQLSAARQAYMEALRLCHFVSSLRCEAEAANNAGWASEQLGEFNPAITRLHEACADWRLLGDRLHEGQTQSNIGLLFYQVADFRNAIVWYRRSASLLAGRDQLAYARVLNNLGLTFTSLAQYKQALPFLRQAIAIETSRPDSIAESALPLMNLGRALMLAGDLHAAEQTLNEALSATVEHPNRHARGLVLNNLGQLFWRQRKLDAAEATLNQALEIHKAVRDFRAIGGALQHLGLIARDRGDLAHARQLLEQAIQIQTDSGFQLGAADSMAVLASVQLSMGDYPSAEKMAQRGSVLLESVRRNVPGPELRATFYDHEREFLDVLVDVAMRPGNPHSIADGLLAAEVGRARSLLDALAAGSLAHAIPPKFASERLRIQQQVDLLSLRLSSAPKEEQDELRKTVEALLARNLDLDIQIRTSLADANIGQPIASVEKLQFCCIPSDATILEYHLGAKLSHLWLVGPTLLKVFELPPRSQIEKQAEHTVSLLRHLADRQRSEAKQNEFEAALRELSATLLGPLKDVNLPKRLLLVLDGSLNRVPFAALYEPRTKSYLGLCHDLIWSPSASYLTAGRSPTQAQRFPHWILAVADPIFSPEDPRVAEDARRESTKPSTPDLARLFFTDDIAVISKLVPVRHRVILKGFDASPARVLSLPLQEFGILHFSTHAVIDDRVPELSRVALSMFNPRGVAVDGFLHQHQLSDMHLAGSVVVLSTCESGLGKLLMGEGLIGLSGSLFHAGAAQLVLSVANVDAEPSALFFSKVYQRVLGEHPEGFERAMTFARNEMAHSRRWSDPYFWSTFVLIGKPSQD